MLIVDEPTRGIDVGSKSEIYGLLSDLAKQGMAIIVVSSEIEEIMGVCDSVVTIFEGKKTAQLDITPADPGGNPGQRPGRQLQRQFP